MTYQAIETARDLPPAGPLNDRAREKSDLDFKTYVDAKTMWEHAKDIAAFANALGGVILVGADDASGSLVYPGVKGQTVKELEKIFYDAAELCSPIPTVDVIGIPERNVVAVNVEPYLDQPVAAPGRIVNAQGVEQMQERAWRFPLRKAAQTGWIKPENLAMYMNPDVRRAVLLLAKIRPAARKKVQVHYHVREMNGSEALLVETMPVSLAEVSIEANFVELIAGNVSCRVPLVDVQDVWESRRDEWSIRLAGTLTEKPTGRDARRQLTYDLLPRRS